MGQRLDIELVVRGLAPTRSQARDLVRRGCVKVAGTVAAKPGAEVGPDAIVEVASGAQPYVSRGGLKLAAALAAFGLDPKDAVALDIGASTGGFTDVLLRAGARRVYAVDVGTAQLHPSLAADPRVLALEAHDIRAIGPTSVHEPVDAIVADVSFISLTQALPPALALAAPHAWLVALIKPQFEVGREYVGKGGIVRDPAARAAAVARIENWLATLPGWRVLGTIQSPIAGGAGNIEHLIGARREA